MGHDDRDEDEERSGDGNRLDEARNRASRVGTALMVAAILCFLSNFGALMALQAWYRQQPKAEPPRGLNAEDRAQFERGRDAAPFCEFVCVGFVSLVYVPVLIGGIALQRGSGRTLGLVAAVFALFPLSLGVLISFPIAIWAFIVLNNEDVSDALTQNQRYDDDSGRRRRRRRPSRD